MARKLPPQDPIRTYQRKAVASRRVGSGRKCSCGETRPEALIAGSRPTICAACQRKKRGQSTLDAHHVAGESNSPVKIRVPVNDHRATLSPAQYDWPKKTRENPHRSPLLAAAASTRGYVDTTDYLRERLLLRNAEMLEILDTILTNRLGPKWWIGTELEQFAPKQSRPNAAP